MANLTITSWNMRSLNSAGPYAHELVKRHGTDILCISEHRLYDSELHKLHDLGLDFEVHAKASYDLKDRKQSRNVGHCGIAILWNKELSHRVRVRECNSDRICVIEVIRAFEDRSLFIFGVYLPHQQCKISSFSEHLQILMQTVAKCKVDGEVIVIGDMNCHFGKELGPRFNGKTTPNAKLLLNATVAEGFEIVDSDPKICSGPSYTFHAEGIGTSYIDHCIASCIASLHIKQCTVIDDDFLNMSDHLPISATVLVDSDKNDTDDVLIEQSSAVAWNKINADQIKITYTEPIKQDLKEIDILLDGIGITKNDSTELMIDNATEKLCSTIQEHCNKLPQKRFTEYLKPYWNSCIKQLNKNKKGAWEQWKASGGIHDNNELHRKYKEAKKVFTRSLHAAKREYELQNMEDINTSNEIDLIYFWKLVNRQKKRTTLVHPIKLDDDTTLTDPNEIREAWREYFQKLFMPDKNSKFDDEFKHLVEEKLKGYTNDVNLVIDDILKYDFDIDEVNEVINSMNNKKAPGWDNVTAESIKHGGMDMANTITKLCNIITRMEYIPWHYKIGILITIPKGNKNKAYQDNYRGITLLPVLAKILEKCYMKRIEAWAREHHIIINIQGATQEKCSSMHTAWVVKETIASNREKGKTTYIGLLDIRKAFDTVWQDGMLSTIYEVGLRGKIWRMIRLLYQDFTCKVLIGGKRSGDIRALRGIHQGAPCSMWFFALFLNDLLQSLQSFYPGIKLCGLTVNCVAFADDITLMASCKTDLQSLFDIAHRYSVKWHFEFNPTKCVAMVFGRDLQNRMDMKLGGHVLKMSDNEPHLGNVLATSSMQERAFINKRIQSCQPVCYAAQSLGSKCVPVTPVVTSRLYKSACIPKLCYAVEVMDIDSKSLEAMETFHTGNAKMFQGLPHNTCNIGSLIGIGWSTISAHIDICRLLFMWRILFLPMTCIYKVIMTRRILKQLEGGGEQYGPVCKMLEASQKYGVLEMLIGAVMDGHYESQNELKRKVKGIILAKDIKNLKISCHLYKAMSLYETDSLQTHTMLAWWCYAMKIPWDIKKCRLIVKLILNSYRLGRQNCSFCVDGRQNSIAHILFECSHTEDTRVRLWGEFCKICPNQLKCELERMSAETRCKFLLNALNSKFVTEWIEVYSHALQYIYCVYMDYHKGLSD